MQEEQIFSMIVNENEITWQQILYDLVRNEQMDPWDIDVSILSQKYLDVVRKLRELDLRISGNVLLCCAILLKIKSGRLIDSLAELDRIIAGTPIDEEGFYEDLEGQYNEQERREIEQGKYKLIPRSPQPRKRKISIYDLINALDKALEVKQRRVMRSIPASEMLIPKKAFDINYMIRQLYGKISTYFSKNLGKRLTFSQLIPSEGREDKVMTLIPLLHLSNLRRIDLEQEEHFGEIEVMLHTKKAIDKDMQEPQVMGAA